MKNICLLFLVISTLVIIQNCATLEKTAEEKAGAETEVVDKELLTDVQELKAMFGYEPKKTTALDTEKIKQPVEFGMNLKQVQERFPVPGKFEYDPRVNRKVTMLARNSAGGHFTFFFYEDGLYKIVTIKKWSNFTLKFAEDDINKFTKVFLENNGKPDLVESDEMRKKMIWIKEDLEITLEEFSLMSHRGMDRVLSLVYADRNILPLAKKDESFELYKPKRRDIIDQ